ncbi:hypothetical protein BS78_02G266900 [Paspalum vaginatum]|nr:hypothetical protein BS78_02G266900 [Paspalum vaginatum]
MLISPMFLGLHLCCGLWVVVPCRRFSSGSGSGQLAPTALLWVFVGIRRSLGCQLNQWYFCYFDCKWISI